MWTFLFNDFFFSILSVSQNFKITKMMCRQNLWTFFLKGKKYEKKKFGISLVPFSTKKNFSGGNAKTTNIFFFKILKYFLVSHKNSWNSTKTALSFFITISLSQNKVLIFQENSTFFLYHENCTKIQQNKKIG